VVAFVASLIVLFLLFGLIVPFAKRRPIGTPFTWGEAMVASTWAFFLMWWAYGVVPHLWLTWADNELNWRPDVLLSDYAPFLGFLDPVEAGGSFPFSITMQTVRDLIAVIIYVVFLGINIWGWAYWQDRGKRAEKAKELVTSDYGRPLVKSGA
jgi:hypothetical protein